MATATIPPKRRFIGRTADSNASSNGAAPSSINSVPPEILKDAFLNAAIDALLPKNYGFEVHKSIWQIRKYKIQRVALQVGSAPIPPRIDWGGFGLKFLQNQMPEGLSMYACALADLVERFTDAE